MGTPLHDLLLPRSPADLSRPSWMSSLGPATDAQRPTPQPPKTSGLFRKVGIPAMIGGQALDYGSTLAALQQPGAQEGNPVMRGAASNPITLALAKMGPAAALAYLLEKKLAPNHPKLATGVAIGVGALGAGLGARNLAVRNALKARVEGK
jgi:hypothetical protein